MNFGVLMICIAFDKC